MDETEDDIPCTQEDLIRCKYSGCGEVSFVKHLRPVEYETLPRPSGGFDKTEYLYCPYCTDPTPKAFSWGNGKRVLGGNVELVQSFCSTLL